MTLIGPRAGADRHPGEGRGGSEEVLDLLEVLNQEEGQ